MAIKLTSKANTVGVSAAYPFGNIKDRVGSTPGTAVNTINHADFHQFFEKMMNYATVTHNGLPDNQTNGFQLFEAFLKATRQDLPTLSTDVWTTNDVFTSASFVTGASSGSVYVYINAQRSGGFTHISGVARIQCDTATGAITTPNEMYVDLSLVSSLLPNTTGIPSANNIWGSGAIIPTLSASLFDGAIYPLYNISSSVLRIVFAPTQSIVAGTFLGGSFNITYRSVFP